MKPSDFDTVPLCFFHHGQGDQIGWKSFQRIHKVVLIDLARMWADASPYKGKSC